MSPLWPVGTDRVDLATGPFAAFALHAPAKVKTDIPPILLIHGFRGGAMEWGPLAEHLSATRDVWAPELIVDPARRSDDLHCVHAVLDQTRRHAGGPAVDVVGSSMGGFVSVSWASTRVETVRNMTLLAPALVPLQPIWRVPGMTRLIALQPALDADESRWESQLSAATIDDFFAADASRPSAIPPLWRQAILDRVREAGAEPAAAGRRQARQDALRFLMSTLRRRGAIGRMLAKLELPVLWLHGDADARVPFRTSREVARRLPNCTFERLSGIGHVPHLECPSLVARKIEEHSGNDSR